MKNQTIFSKTKITLALLSTVLMSMTSSTFALPCLTPCTVSGATNPVMILEADNTSQDWFVQNVDGSLRMGITNVKNVLKIDGYTPENSFVIDSSGDYSMANGSVFIDESANKVGIGTTTPAHELDLVSPSPTIRLNDIDGGVIWELNQNAFASTFDIANATAGVSMLKIINTAPENSLVLNDGGVGIGTTVPETALHVRKADAVATIEDITAGGVKNILQLKRPGSVGFVMEDTALGQAWDFRTAGNGGFLVSNIGVPGSKIQVNLDGSVFLNGGGFSLNGNTNNVIVGGTHTAVQHIASSSREVKKDFAKVDGKAVMDKIKNLEVTEWRYKDEAAQGKHIGPMAEDFYKLFNLGADNKHVSATDMASISLVASKELQLETEVLKEQLKAKDIKLAELQERLSSLEKLVSNFVLSGKSFPETNAKVVLMK